MGPTQQKAIVATRDASRGHPCTVRMMIERDISTANNRSENYFIGDEGSEIAAREKMDEWDRTDDHPDAAPKGAFRPSPSRKL